MSSYLFRGIVAASVLSSSVALAHVSVNSGPAAADKTSKITFGVGHGCEIAGVHYDTAKVRIEIPTGVTGVRALFSDFGKPTVTKSGADVTEITWTKPAGDVLGDDDAYYEISIRAKIPNTPFTKIQFNVHQVCIVNNVEMTQSWTLPDGATGNTAPLVTVVPARLNPTGWNKFTIPAGTTVPAAKLGTYFGDAQIVWKGTAAYSSNTSTVALIAATAGVTALTGDLVAGDEVWVRY